MHSFHLFVTLSYIIVLLCCIFTSPAAPLASLARTLESDNLKGKLGVTNTETPSSSGSSVFVGILVTGLLAALAIVVGYLKCPRRSDTKGVRLAEEAYPADQENQGNTLVSVAPLNPPLETPEKPSVNGESPEEAKTQPPPPTNGHSTTKTADTEL
uniref:CD34 molecule n=1 Tax=Sander lucioperca TaxID=283035 RepID=A0A8C9XVL0_SANLU